MAISTTRILDNAIGAIEAAGRYGDLSGDELEDAKAATREGLAYLVDAIVDEIRANAEVTVSVSVATISGDAGTDGLAVIDGGASVIGTVQGDAGVTGTGVGTGTGGIA